jgi:iron complex outermembrane receptor protein
MRRHTARGEAELRPAGGPLASLRAAGTFTDYQHTELEASGSVGTRFDQQLAAGELSARHDALGPLSQGAAGVRAQFRDITTGGALKTPSTYDWALAGYLVEEVGSGPLRLQLGARYDWARYEPRDTAAFVDVGGERIPVRPRTFGAVSGSLGGLYEVSSGVRVGASVSRAYRTPDFNELYSNGPHLAAGTYDVGDPSLDKETGLGTDLFVRVQRPGLRAEAAAFRNQLDGYVFPSSRGRVELGTQGGVARAQYTNEDAVFTGWEGDLEWSVASRLVLEGTVSSVSARFTSAREPIPVIEGVDTTFIAASRFPPLIPPLHGRAGLRWDAGRWSLGGTLRAAARQDRTGDFEEPTDGYVVGDLTAGLRLQRGVRVHTLTLRLDNVANTEYRDHLARTKAIMPQPGRGLSLLYRLTY